MTHLTPGRPPRSAIFRGRRCQQADICVFGGKKLRASTYMACLSCVAGEHFVTASCKELLKVSSREVANTNIVWQEMPPHTLGGQLNKTHNNQQRETGHGAIMF